MLQMRNFRFVAMAGMVLALAAMVVPARAQDADDLKRGVARLSLINGDVSVRRGEGSEWVAGVINAPLLTDDRVATGATSRTEVQFDAADVLRLGANAELRLTQIEYGHYQMELARGVMTYRVLRAANANIEIDTPSLSVRPTREGSVRISVNDAGETEVTARGGDVEIFTPRGSQWIRNGQTMMARGAASDPEFQVVNAGGMDEWDRWCDSRDRMMMQSVSSRYVGPGVYGAEDLDNSGAWTNVPEYGNVWHPTGVAADWAPYQYGRWVWQDWYGWTWVSYDPWGWAPYHYGRWFYYNRIGWCWYPGLITARHYWSPALVGFVGFGAGGGFGFGFGNIGWVPLAPYEVFHPWWGRGFYGPNRFNRGVNITNVNITNVYRNARVTNGVSAVRVSEFQSGSFNHVARFSGNQIREAGVVHGQMPFAPGNSNLRFSDRQASVAPRTNENTRFFTHQQPTPVQRMGNPGVAQPNGIRGGQAGGAGQDSNGWRRFGSPQSAAPQTNQPGTARNGFGTRGDVQRNDRPAASPSQGGWQRFGSPAPSNNSAPAQRQAAPAPRQDYRSSPYSARPQQQYNPPSANRYTGPSNSRQESLRIAPPVVRERPSSPGYSAPRQSAPSYSAPRQSAPRQSAPSNGGSRGNSGGNHGGRSR
jgi:hypothetical protein